MLLQISMESFEENRRASIRHNNRVIKFAVKNKESLHFPKLDPKSLRVVGFSDASFAGNKDYQLGYLVLVATKPEKIAPVIFKSFRAGRDGRSVRCAVPIAFSDMFDARCTLAEQLRYILPDSRFRYISSRTPRPSVMLSKETFVLQRRC